MWSILQTSEGRHILKVFDRATIGRAGSNIYSIESPLFRALHAQFMKRDDRMFVRCFETSEEQELEHEKKVCFDGWSLLCGTEGFIWEACQSDLLESFRQTVQRYSQDLESCEKKISSQWFLGSAIPNFIKLRLRQKFDEYILKGPIEKLLGDPEVSDVLVVNSQEIWVERNGSLQRSAENFSNPQSYQIYVENLLSRNGKSLDEVRPAVNFSYEDGTRFHLIGKPVSAKHPYLSIRKPRENLMTLENLSQRGMFSNKEHSFLKQILSDRLNILISGATGSGKTTLIKALLSAVSEDERILILEDAPELQTSRANTVYLQTRNACMEGQTEISLRDLVRESLRMRPDRLVLGEVRGSEAFDLIQAMNTGHRGCMGSLHANSPRDAIHRLSGLCLMAHGSISEGVVSSLIANNIHVLLHLEKDVSGLRKITKVAHVRGVDHGQVLLEEI